MPQTFDVTYTAKTGEEKHIFVKAENEAEALQHAKYQCYTGENFHNPIIVDKRFNFEKLYSIITDAITIEKKNRDEFSIPFENAPKILITTNYTIQVDGTSGEDRKNEIYSTPRQNGFQGSERGNK